ncbi:MAG TPA: ChbG/HpnK family deacetylase [Thermoanaerobaculia bacterium]|nr:ChbG/HpnK family deacetylase [Thermoanaerobaculia bacterium]
MSRQLIVTADDAGLHRGMNDGVLRAHRDGIVTACSIVANGAAFEDAVERLRDTPTLEAGVHLALVEEKPLTAMRFPRKYTSFVPLYLARRIPIDAIERELRAQIEKVLATGLRVTHLNGHQHLHLLPRVFAVVARLAREYGIGYVRIVDEKSPRLAIKALSYLGVERRALARRDRFGGLKPAAPQTNDRTIGVSVAGHLRDVVPLLDEVEGVTELVTHPGVAVRGYDHWSYEWDDETRALCDPRLRAELAKRGIALTSPGRLAL